MKRLLLLPAKINARLCDHHYRLFKFMLLILVLITSLYTKKYQGQFQSVVNNNLGGIFYVMFGSLLISVVFPKFKIHWAVLTALTLTCMLEFLQYLKIPFMQEMAHNKVFAYLFGNSFNPNDFLYYFLGAFIVLVLLRMMERSSAETE
jgi:hypothetical protein